MSNTDMVLNKGEYYTTLQDGDFFVDVYKHKTVPYLYVIEINGYKNSLTTVVTKQRYRKEIDEIFFIPIAAELWNEQGVFDNIKRCRVAM